MLSTLNCPYLQTTRGFDDSVLPTNSVTVTGPMTGASIQAAIDSLPASGGFVDIPAGVWLINSDIILDDGAFLRGAGVGQTLLTANGATNVVYKKHGENVGVFDLTIEGELDARRGVFFWYVNNAVVDNVEVYEMDDSGQGNGIQFRYVNGGTIQNSMSRFNATHGIVSDDCQATPTDQPTCLAEFNSDFQGYGTQWTQNILIAGNYAHSNGDYGIDWHGRDSEIACNTLENNFTGGAKTQDAQDLWFHHNTFINNGSLDYRISQEFTGVAPGANGPNVIWANDFTQESNATIRFNAPTTNTYLVCNLYDGNGSIIAEAGADVFITESDPTDGTLFDDEVPGGISLPTSTAYDYLKSVAEPCEDTITFSVVVPALAERCFCLKPYDPAANQPPVIEPINNLTTAVGESFTIQPNISDPDGDSVTCQVSGLPPGATFTFGDITGTPSVAGVYNVSITCDDGNGGTDTELFTWTVEDESIECELCYEILVDGVAVPNGQLIEIEEGQRVTVDASCSTTTTGGAMSVYVDWGNGTTGTGASTVQEQYNIAGQYDISVTVGWF